ncbi:TPA: hypothetical protein DHW62_00185 [candidate division WWE3 bacterium]|uniref:ATP-dependent Clp protease proteolytic subunit n=1 Tax=candidate division WWE3 bacterium TaxID=2053526 RepID=A0A656PP25_UNCKA|nr:hypothetical protein P147_WWE3C00001G0232 [candidate division WWE3 bacterium RAAC2_WWE3_1]OGC68582.1 MAG: hypothetical protein A2364_00075 [candidate division WWE3 bacterium RIFOXYB1_FULL_43_12]HAI95445.1 hypothetical protein [candidate division WWE3 bacterium]HBL00202.1 hypothetical protein [candidate division WWE3 bacterium]HBT66532.1 hypothetical protein [candidate division WWE3 bacterium]
MKMLINFYANVSEQSVNNLIVFITDRLAHQDTNNPFDELIIQISSSGGSSDHGLLAYNFLRQTNIPKTIIGMGNVDSAALMIYCAGDKRLSTPSCRFVLHEARATINGEFGKSKLYELAKLIRRITDDYSEVVTKVTGKSRKFIRSKVNKGTVLSADEAKRVGLVDEITDKPYSEMKDLAIFIINNPQTQHGQQQLQQPHPNERRAEV